MTFWYCTVLAARELYSGHLATGSGHFALGWAPFSAGEVVANWEGDSFSRMGVWPLPARYLDGQSEVVRASEIIQTVP